jgi:hypothetical protein
MNMKTTVTKSAFMDAFRAHDRYDQFGYTALSSLFAYLEDLENDMGEEIEFDVIALCCDYSVDTVEDIAANYSIEAEEGEDLRDAVLDYLNDNTTVVDDDCDGSILYCSTF